MAAKPSHLLVDCPPSRHDGGGDGGQRRAGRNDPAGGGKARLVVVLVFLAAAFIACLTFLGIFLDIMLPSTDPVYTVAITGVTGLDVLSPPPPPPSPPADDDYSSSSPSPPVPTALSPVFNLTFQIDNTPKAFYEECVSGLSRADVSYGDAFLAGGSVPPFCAGQNRRSDGVAARVWGENVAVPQFLRDQLAAELAAGDASVDVKVTMPRFCWKGWCGGTAVLSCKPKIGGASPPCRLDYLWLCPRFFM